MWIFILVLLLAPGGIAALIVWERNASRTWTVVTEGEFDRFEKRQHRYSTRSGAMVHTTTHHVITVTDVYLADGTRVVCWGGLDPSWPKGTRIRVLRNGLGSYKVEPITQ